MTAAVAIISSSDHQRYSVSAWRSQSVTFFEKIVTESIRTTKNRSSKS